MPVNFIQEKKKQKYLVFIVGAVIITIFIVLWFGYLRKPKAVVEVIPVSVIKAIEVDFKVLEHPFLKEFQPFEKAPLFDGEKGRKNPFLPY